MGIVIFLIYDIMGINCINKIILPLQNENFVGKIALTNWNKVLYNKILLEIP